MNPRPVFACVPNVAEGRDLATIDACAAAITATGALLADRTSDAVHHRSVFTVLGDEPTLLRASVALARVTTERIDLRTHRGAHPRIGALDVLPFVALHDASLADAVRLANLAAEAIARELGVPSLLYGAAARRPERRLLATVRRGEFEGLTARAAGGELPDVGATLPHPSAGAIAVGARGVLVAFNVVLATGDLAVATAIARRLRERDGGLATVRALGLRLDERRVQVSCNLTDPEAVPPHRLVALVRTLAAGYGVAVAEGELIGLAPRAAFRSAAESRFRS